MDDKFRSRKFMFATTILALASLFLWLDKIGGGEWVTICTLIMGIYAAGNVVEKRDAL